MLTGSCEIIGVFVGLFLILYTSNKWLWTGLFNIVAGCIAYTAWIIPSDSELIYFTFYQIPFLTEIIDRCSQRWFPCGIADVLSDGIKGCHLFNFSHFDNVYRWARFYWEEENLCIFNNRMGANMAVDGTVCRRHHRVRSIDTSNGIRIARHHRWHSDNVDQQSTHNTKDKEFKSTSRIDATNLDSQRKWVWFEN